MADPNNSGNTPPRLIRHAIKRIGEHPHVEAVEPVETGPDGFYLTLASITTNLPTAWRTNGESPTGVRLIEPVIFSFPVDYPANPPRVFLRESFNRSLPHLQPGVTGEPVEPCYVDGSTRLSIGL